MSRLTALRLAPVARTGCAVATPFGSSCTPFWFGGCPLLLFGMRVLDRGARAPQSLHHLGTAHEAAAVARVEQLVDDAPRQHRALLDRHARRRGLAGDGAQAGGAAVPGALART